MVRGRGSRGIGGKEEVSGLPRRVKDRIRLRSLPTLGRFLVGVDRHLLESGTIRRVEGIEPSRGVGPLSTFIGAGVNFVDIQVRPCGERRSVYISEPCNRLIAFSVALILWTSKLVRELAPTGTRVG